MPLEQPEPRTPQDTPPTLTPVAPVPVTIMPATNNNKGAMPDFNPANIPSMGIQHHNGIFQPSGNDIAVQPPSASVIDGTQPLGPEPDGVAASHPSSLRDVDPQVIEALRGKDRIYVLKLGELMEGLIHDERRQRIELTPATSYQRLLVHRCSAYYKLAPEPDPVSKGIFVYSTPESRIPTLRISELVPPETSTQPAFKIMRRSSANRRNKSLNQTGSVTGEDDLSDLDPSETGSLGGRSNTTGGSTKKHMTIEQREAAYNEARSRIFMGFDEKVVKDKDVNSSSSSLSATSGSIKNGGGRDGGSSTGDADSSSSSPATESEWSGPGRKDKQHHSGNASASSSTRSIRSSAYISNGSGSSRNSRAASPSPFQYASLYEPAPSMSLYDPAQHPAPTGPAYHPSYAYSFNQGQPNPSYVSYPYYPPPYPPFSTPPHPQQNPSEHPTPSNGDHYPAPPHLAYGPPYMWPHPGPPPPLQSPPLQPPPAPVQAPPSNNPHPMNSPPGQPPYQTYMPPPHPYPYPMPGYYPGQHGHLIPPPPPPPQPPHIHGPQLFDPRSSNHGPGSGPMNGIRTAPAGNGIPPPPNSRGPSISRNNHNIATNGSVPNPRNGSMQPSRAPWSYGPGIGSGGFVATGSHLNETVGPRLSNTRRQNNLSGSSTNGRSTSGDDVSSIASSSSSSSRRTQTVTAGSQHPLPARPDWAINLKPHNSRTMSPIAAPRSISGGSIQPNYSPRHPSHQPISLQSTDFPPLTSMQLSDRRAPGPSGAWGNPPARSLFGQANSGPNGDGIPNCIDNRLDETGFDRPPPKSAELYNPKLPKRASLNLNNAELSRTQPNNDSNTGEAIAHAALVNQVATLSLENNTATTEFSAPPSSQ